MNQSKLATSLKPRLRFIDGRLTTTSLDVAEKFGKEHHNVLKAIRNLECSEEFGHVNFNLCHEISMLQNGKPLPYYRMTKDGFMFLAMGFTGKEAARLKESYITAFNLMETRLVEVARAVDKLDQARLDKPLDFSNPDNLATLTPDVFLRIFDALGRHTAPAVLVWWLLKQEAYREPVRANLRAIEADVGHIVRKSAIHYAINLLVKEGMVESSGRRGVPSDLLLLLDVLNERVAKSFAEGHLEKLFTEHSLDSLADLKPAVLH